MSKGRRIPDNIRQQIRAEINKEHLNFREVAKRHTISISSAFRIYQEDDPDLKSPPDSHDHGDASNHPSAKGGHDAGCRSAD